MNALTERYVHAALSAAPSRQRAELEPEIRALVADAVDARGGDERVALTELGDPRLLAARYTERPRYLIGPALFPEWRRILLIVLPIAVPIITAIVLAANLINEQAVGEAIVAALGAGVSVALQTAFWLTLVFAVIERVGAAESAKGRQWTVDDLPALPDQGRVGVGEGVGELLANVLALVALLWVQLSSPIVIDGVGYPLFDPALSSFWLPWFIVVLAVQVVLSVVRIARRRWTWGSAIANALLNVAFAGPALYLLVNGQLFNPALVAEVTEITGDAWMRPTATITAVAIAAIVTWDSIEPFLKAYRASGGLRPVATGPTEQ